MSNYTTQDLQDNLNYLSETKTQIKQAITDKGQVIADTDTFRSYAQKIKDISSGVKLFETEEAMQADPSPKVGDLATVYKSTITNATVSSQFQTANFPTTVTLPTAITSSVEVIYRAVDTSKMFDCIAQLDSSGFRMDCYTESGNITINYTSIDGKTYTRTDNTGNPVDFGTQIYYEIAEMWNDAIGYFIQVGGYDYKGLFEYGSSDFTNVRSKMLINSDNVSTDYYEIRPEFERDISSKAGGRQPLVVVHKSHLDKNGLYNIIDKCTLYWYYTAASQMSIYKTTDDKYFLMFGYDSKCSTSEMFEITEYDFTLENPVVSTKQLTGDNVASMYTAIGYNTGNGASFPAYKVVDLTTDNVIVYLNSRNSTNDGMRSDINVASTTLPYNGYIVSTSTNGPDKYLIADVWNYAPTQLNAAVNDLLPSKIAYGKDGIITGDGSVYNNLNIFTVLELLGIAYSQYSNLPFELTPNKIYSVVENDNGDSLIPVFNYVPSLVNVSALSGYYNIYFKKTQDYIIVCDCTSSWKFSVYTKEMTFVKTFEFSSMDSNSNVLGIIQEGSNLYIATILSSGTNAIVKGITLNLSTGVSQIYSNSTSSGSTNPSTYRICSCVEGFIKSGDIGTILGLYLDSSGKPQPMVITIDYNTGTITFSKKSLTTLASKERYGVYNSIVIGNSIYVGVYNSYEGTVLFKHDVSTNTTTSYKSSIKISGASYYAFVLDESVDLLYFAAESSQKLAFNYSTNSMINMIVPVMIYDTTPCYISSIGETLPLYMLSTVPVGTLIDKHTTLVLSSGDEFKRFYSDNICIVIESSDLNNLYLLDYKVIKGSLKEGLDLNALETYLKSGCSNYLLSYRWEDYQGTISPS